MALKFITAEEAASYVHHNDNVGFSGFTPAGCPKVVPGAIARKAAEEHAKGNPFQIGMFTGASTGMPFTACAFSWAVMGIANAALAARHRVFNSFIRLYY